MKSLFRLVFTLSLASVFSMIGGCVTTRPRTEVVVQVRADATIARDTRTLRVTVEGGVDHMHYDRHALCGVARVSRVPPARVGVACGPRCNACASCECRGQRCERQRDRALSTSHALHREPDGLCGCASLGMLSRGGLDMRQQRALRELCMHADHRRSTRDRRGPSRSRCGHTKA